MNPPRKLTPAMEIEAPSGVAIFLAEKLLVLSGPHPELSQLEKATLKYPPVN
jgi:hypothetical protein